MSRTGVAVAVLAIIVGSCSSGGSRLEGDGGLTAEGGSHDAAAASSDAPSASCAIPQDCVALLTPGPAVFCCIHDVCIVGQAAEALTCSNPAEQNIMASSYDQSCQGDLDCVAIREGNFCEPGTNNGCVNATISRSALPKYDADLAKTMAGVCVGLSGCPNEIVPCCLNGTCQMNAQCQAGIIVPPPSDAAPDAADANAEAGDTGAE